MSRPLERPRVPTTALSATGAADRRTARFATATAAVVAGCLLVLTGCGVTAVEQPTATGATTATGAPSQRESMAPPTPTADASTSAPKETAPPASGSDARTAVAALATLQIKGRVPMTGYDRDRFGTEWSDAVGDFCYTRNGCDTRNDILARDLQRETVESNGCVVTAGILAYEPYTGEDDRPFVKGGSYEQAFDVEHIVALGNAWATGAQRLSEERRAELANDPVNLMLTDPSLNRSKGDADFATWLPPNKPFRCSYAARQIRVKQKYQLWMTAPEKAAMERVLATCPNEPLAQPDPQAGHKASEPGPKPAKQKTQPPPDTGGSSGGSTGGGLVYYENCDVARADGAAPVRRGDPGYGSHLDRDGDGSGCE